jgi:hypothetical protein
MFEAPHITWVHSGGTVNLKVKRFDETTIYATLAGPFYWPDKADSMWFAFNRLAGQIEVEYAEKPNADDFMAFLTDFSQRGTCTKSRPAF